MNERQLYYGDNLDILRKYFRDDVIDLCYIDPPFNSKRNYNQIYNNLGKEDQAQAQAFTDTWTWDTRAIEGLDEICSNHRGILTKQTIELMQGLLKVLGKGSLLAYLVSMTLRISEIWRVLKPTGSFYLHCDPTCSHYLKILLDAIFCGHGGDFRNEIVWHYRKWATRQTQFVSNHDIIFFYSKTDQKERVFHQLFMERAASTLKRFGKSKIVSGHDETGKRLPSKMGKQESEGVALDDVWDIGRVAPIKQLYPTQKPEELLERILYASSSEGDIVLDAYCGCGTTVNVAERLRRRWCGIDITYHSISVVLKRLEDSFGKELLSEIQLNGVPQDIEAARALADKKDDRVRKEFEKWAVLTYTNNRAVINEKKGGDKGIDGIAFVQETADEYKPVIFSVKSGKVHPTMVRDLRGTVEREQAAMGVLLTLDPPGRGSVQEAKAAGVYQNPLMAGQAIERLQIVTIEDLLQGKRLALPMTHDVLKRAIAKDRSVQQTLF